MSSRIEEWISSLSREMIGELQLLVAILFFGASFVIQKYGMIVGIKPITFNAGRYIVATLILSAITPLLRRFVDSELPTEKNSEQEVVAEEETSESKWKKTLLLLLWGGHLGIANSCGTILQQVGMVTVSAGKSGFITGLYVVFIPIVEYFIPGLGVHLNAKIWAAVGLSIIGMYFLSGCAETSVCFGEAFKAGEVIIIISMFCWVWSITVTNVGAKKVDVLSMTFIQFSVCLVSSLCLASIFERDMFQYPYTTLRENWMVIVGIGFTEGIGFTSSALGQMYCNPTKSAVMLSLESLPTAFFAYIFLQETLSMLELFGCFILVIAALLSTAGFEKPEEEELLPLVPNRLRPRSVNDLEFTSVRRIRVRSRPKTVNSSDAFRGEGKSKVNYSSLETGEKR